MAMGSVLRQKIKNKALFYALYYTSCVYNYSFAVIGCPIISWIFKYLTTINAGGGVSATLCNAIVIQYMFGSAKTFMQAFVMILYIKCNDFVQ